MLHNNRKFFNSFSVEATEENGATFAPWEGWKQPQLAQTVETCVSQLKPDNAEVINRPAGGLSELGGVVLHFQPEMNVIQAVHSLKWQEHPDLVRSDQHVKDAVLCIFELCSRLRAKRPDFSFLLGFPSAGNVDVAWMANLSSLTSPGKYVELLKEVPTKNAEAKTAMCTDPVRGKLLLGFFVKEFFVAPLPLHGIRAYSTQQAAAPSTAFVTLSRDEEEAPTPTHEEPEAVQSLKRLREELLTMEVPKAQRANRLPKRGRVTKFQDSFDAKSAQFLQPYHELGQSVPDQVSEIDARSVQTHVERIQKLMQKLLDQY